MKNTPITSAQRALICRLVDLAIDVTQQGRYVAEAEYHGASHGVLVMTYPIGTLLSSEQGVLMECFMNRYDVQSEAEHAERVNSQLGAMLKHLTAKLQEGAA